MFFSSLNALLRMLRVLYPGSLHVAAIKCNVSKYLFSESEENCEGFSHTAEWIGCTFLSSSKLTTTELGFYLTGTYCLFCSFTTGEGRHGVLRGKQKTTKKVLRK